MKSRFGFTLIMAAGLAIVASDMVMAQPDSGQRLNMRGEGRIGSGDNALGLLQNEGIRDELEMVQAQVEEFQALRDEMTRGMREMFQGMRELSTEKRREKFAEHRTEIESRRKELENRVQDLLLPHQKERLNQLAVQSQSRRNGGTLGFISSDRIVEALEITDAQRDKLKEKVEHVRKDLEEKISELRNKAEEEVLSVLTSEQRQKYKQMFGESYELGDRKR